MPTFKTTFTLIALLLSLPSAAFTIAVVGKTKNDSFYEQSFKGCLKFASQHSDVNCIYDGADDYQDVRTQVLIVKDLIKRDVDALLVSTTDSAFLVKGALKTAQKKGIPVITFDSDLLPEHQNYRLAYVGTNNFEFGVALGIAAKAHKKQHSQLVCIQSGHQTTPNLNARVEGVRFALSGEKTTRLTGQNGWVEFERCPLFTMGKREDAIKQLLTIIDMPTAPIFVAVAGFAQFNPDYLSLLSPYKAQIVQDTITIISADTEEQQLEILEAGLSTINIGQNPFEMGRKGAELLFNYKKMGQKPLQDKYYLPFHYCNRDNAKTCTINH